MLWDNSIEAIDPCHCASDKCCCCNTFSSKDNVETAFMGSPMKQDADLSLYENASPISISSSRCVHQNKRRRPLEDVDNNSRDSGYGTSCNGETRFLSPKTSFCSSSSVDEFLDVCSLDENEENAQLPGEFCNLISSRIVNKDISPEVPRNLRRSISMPATSSSSRARSCLFQRNDENLKCFKRPEPPTERTSPNSIKRYKTTTERIPAKLHDLSLSENEDSIKTALQRSSTEPDLIGDFSKQFCLPLITGKHSDLKSIAPSILVGLMKGEFQHCVASFEVVDCRFPYEFEGGHISGAVNLYNKEQIIDELLNIKIKQNAPVREHEDHRRQILVFHCEFSSERGPNLLRYLRQIDRNHNMQSYPNLHFPEIYLLDGGYKNFYAQFPELCVPKSYLPMLHPGHKQDLKFFRTKAKSFNKDSRSKTLLRSFKRL